MFIKYYWNTTTQYLCSCNLLPCSSSFHKQPLVSGCLFFGTRTAIYLIMSKCSANLIDQMSSLLTFPLNSSRHPPFILEITLLNPFNVSLTNSSIKDFLLRSLMIHHPRAVAAVYFRLFTEARWSWHLTSNCDGYVVLLADLRKCTAADVLLCFLLRLSKQASFLNFDKYAIFAAQILCNHSWNLVFLNNIS